MQSFNFTVLPFKIGGDSNYAAHRSVKFLLHTNYAFVMMLSASALLIDRQCYNLSSVLFLQNIRGEYYTYSSEKNRYSYYKNEVDI